MEPLFRSLTAIVVRTDCSFHSSWAQDHQQYPDAQDAGACCDIQCHLSVRKTSGNVFCCSCQMTTLSKPFIRNDICWRAPLWSRGLRGGIDSNQCCCFSLRLSLSINAHTCEPFYFGPTPFGQWSALLVAGNPDHAVYPLRVYKNLNSAYCLSGATVPNSCGHAWCEDRPLHMPTTNHHRKSLQQQKTQTAHVKWTELCIMTSEIGKERTSIFVSTFLSAVVSAVPTGWSGAGCRGGCTNVLFLF